MTVGQASLRANACRRTGGRGRLSSLLANPKVIKTLEDIKADDDTAFTEGAIQIFQCVSKPINLSPQFSRNRR